MDFSLERRVQRDQYCLDRLWAVASGIPLTSSGVDQRLDQQCMLLLDLIHGALDIREGVGEFLICGLQGGDVGGHVRGFGATSWERQATSLPVEPLNFAQFAKIS
jgi:hypothetical protein